VASDMPNPATFQTRAELLWTANSAVKARLLAADVDGAFDALEALMRFASDPDDRIRHMARGMCSSLLVRLAPYVAADSRAGRSNSEDG
jgi:hypothetical protein